MGHYRDAQMFGLMDADASGYRDGVNEERHRVAYFLGVTVEDVDGINLEDTEQRLASLRAIVAGAQLKIEELSVNNG